MTLAKLIKQFDGKLVTKAWERARAKGKLDEHSDHDDGWYHPSSLVGCPAMLFLKMERFPIPAEHSDPLKLGPMHRVFANGTYFHERIQVDLARAGVLDLTMLDESMETPICIKKLNLRGHCDGVLNFAKRTRTGKRMTMYGRKVPIYEWEHGDNRAVLELKSIKGDDDKPKSRQHGFCYVQRTGAKPEHILQANIYCRALEIDRMCILYENKNTHEWCEFVEPYSEKLWREVETKIKLVNEWREEFKNTGRIPKGVIKAARETAQRRLPFGIYAADLLTRRLGEETYEDRRKKHLAKMNKDKE